MQYGSKTFEEGTTLSNGALTTLILATNEERKSSLKQNICNETLNFRNSILLKSLSFGRINIRSGKEKDEGAKIYSVAKEVSNVGLLFYCLQEVTN